MSAHLTSKRVHCGYDNYANASSAVRYLHDNISNQLSKYPEAIHIIAGDFNYVDLKAVLSKCHLYLKCSTRGANTLEKAYSNIKHGYRDRPLPHLG